MLDDNSQTVTTGPPTEHSRTPSPHKPPPMSHSNPSATPVFKTNSTIRPSTTSLSPSASNEPSPIYTFLPFDAPSLPPLPPPLPPLVQPSYSLTSSSDVVTQQTTAPPLSGTPSLSIFAPKPFRTSASINLETSHSADTVSNVLFSFWPTVLNHREGKPLLIVHLHALCMSSSETRK